MFFGYINRMILGELLKVFLLALTSLTGMFLLGGLIQEATQKGLGPAQIIAAIPHIVPNTLPYTIPATTLFAVCVVYGRMSADNEVLVLRAAGVNIYHLLWPALILGIGTAALTMSLYRETIPRSQQLLRRQLERDAEEVLYGILKREGGLRQNNLDYVLFVRDVQGRDLIDVVVKKRKADRTGYEFVARSKTAKLFVQTIDEENPADRGPETAPAKKSMMFGPRRELVVHMDSCFVDSLNGDVSAELVDQKYSSALPASIFGKEIKEHPTAMTMDELKARRAEVIEEIGEAEKTMAHLEKHVNDPAPPGVRPFADQLRDWREGQYKHLTRLVRLIDTEASMRPALAFGCLVFVIVGCPVGIRASRSDYLSVFIICFLPAMFIYYPILLASLNLAKEGKVPAEAAWVANILVGLISLILIVRLMKR